MFECPFAMLQQLLQLQMKDGPQMQRNYPVSPEQALVKREGPRCQRKHFEAKGTTSDL